jgi:hypothetical protein
VAQPPPLDAHDVRELARLIVAFEPGIAWELQHLLDSRASVYERLAADGVEIPAAVLATARAYRTLDATIHGEIYELSQAQTAGQASTDV